MANNTIFQVFNYNFDESLYGEDYALSEGGKKTLKLYGENSTGLEDWQIYDVASGDAATRTNYYKNPHATVCSTMLASANLIYTIANTTAFANASIVQNTMISSAASCIVEINKFKSHTDNVSGVSDSTTFTNTNAHTIPTLDTASGIGQQLLLLLNKTDSIENSAPMLGSMTSLFIGDYLASNNTILSTDATTLNNTIYIATIDDGMGNISYVQSSNVSNAVANSIISHLDSVTLLLNTRRVHDWNFFNTGRTVITNAGRVKTFTTMGATEANLVINLIGTDRLTANL